MFRFLRFCALVAVVAAKPGNIHGGFSTAIAAPVAVAAPVLAAPIVAAPTSVSSQSRHDIIHPGIITYHTAHAVPTIVAAPAVPHVAPAPLRFSSAATSSLDLRSRTAPIAFGGFGYGTGIGYGSGLALGGGIGFAGAAGLGGGIGLGYGGHGHGFIG